MDKNKMETERKRLKPWLICIGFAVAVLTVGLLSLFCLSSTDSTERYLKMYCDAELTQLADASEVFFWKQGEPGWDNRTVWVKNVGSKPFMLAVKGVLPEGWLITWDYNGCVIEPRQKIRVTFYVYVPYESQILRFRSPIGIMCLIVDT